jgi:hypothetical protein
MAARDGHKIARERAFWATPFADLVLAAVAAVRGESAAVERAARAIVGFEAAGMAAYAAAARRRHGELVGGDRGAAEVADADAWMRSEGVVNVDRIAGVLAPGFDEVTGGRARWRNVR